MSEPLSPEAARAFFDTAREVFATMTNATPALTPAAPRVQEHAEADLTIVMGMLSVPPRSFLLAMDSETVYAVTRSILRNEADTEWEEIPEGERAELLQGTLEELTNRIVSRLANRLSESTGEVFDVTPPLCLFGNRAELGGTMAGIGATLESELGVLHLLAAREQTEAGDASA